MQNNLTELYSILEFAMPDVCRRVFHNIKDFQFHFEKAIAHWRRQDVAKARRRSWLLFDILQRNRLLLRRDNRILFQHLPPKTEIVLRLRLSPLQHLLYNEFIEEMESSRSALDIFAVTSMIVDHPVRAFFLSDNGNVVIMDASECATKGFDILTIGYCCAHVKVQFWGRFELSQCLAQTLARIRASKSQIWYECCCASLQEFKTIANTKFWIYAWI